MKISIMPISKVSKNSIYKVKSTANPVRTELAHLQPICGPSVLIVRSSVISCYGVCSICSTSRPTSASLRTPRHTTTSTLIHRDSAMNTKYLLPFLLCHRIPMSVKLAQGKKETLTTSFSFSFLYFALINFCEHQFIFWGH